MTGFHRRSLACAMATGRSRLRELGLWSVHCLSPGPIRHEDPSPALLFVRGHARPRLPAAARCWPAPCSRRLRPETASGRRMCRAPRRDRRCVPVAVTPGWRRGRLADTGRRHRLIRCAPDHRADRPPRARTPDSRRWRIALSAGAQQEPSVYRRFSALPAYCASHSLSAWKDRANECAVTGTVDTPPRWTVPGWHLWLRQMPPPFKRFGCLRMRTSNTGGAVDGEPCQVVFRSICTGNTPHSFPWRCRCMVVKHNRSTGIQNMKVVFTPVPFTSKAANTLRRLCDVETVPSSSTDQCTKHVVNGFAFDLQKTFTGCRVSARDGPMLLGSGKRNAVVRIPLHPLPQILFVDFQLRRHHCADGRSIKR